MSIVYNEEFCKPNELMVRARREDDLKAVFTNPTIVMTLNADYNFRAIVNKMEVANMLVSKILEIDYSNFKESIPNTQEGVIRHGYYGDVWSSMFHYGRDRG